MVIPNSQGNRKQCLHELHDCPYSGHLGVAKTQKAMIGCIGGKPYAKTCFSISDIAQFVREITATPIRNQVVCFSHCRFLAEDGKALM